MCYKLRINFSSIAGGGCMLKINLNHFVNIITNSFISHENLQFIKQICIEINFSVFSLSTMRDISRCVK